MLHGISTLVVALIIAGLWFRVRQRAIHLRLMLAAFVVDLLLLLYIEFTRHAVEKVAARFHPLIWFHAGVSLAVLLCYLAMIGLGWRMVEGEMRLRKLHRALGVTFVVFRGLNYVTSFLVA